MGFYPDGWNDATHAGQRAAGEFATIAIGHVITEFEPEWGPWAKKIRLPRSCLRGGFRNVEAQHYHSVLRGPRVEIADSAYAADSFGSIILRTKLAAEVADV